MKKDSRDKAAQERKTPGDYYRLHNKSVEDLANADVSNSPKVSKEELRKYKSGGKFSIPSWVKMLFIKFWFAGAICFFFFWGLGMYVPDLLDMLVILGVALGISTDLLVNNALRFFAETPGDNDRFMMFPKKSYASLFLNILYAFVVLFLVFTLYNLINGVIIGIQGEAETIPLGVGPILFGLFYLGFDMLLIEMKHLLFRIVADARNSVGERKNGKM